MAQARATIVIVEDDPEIRRFLRSALGAEGYKVVESANGAAARSTPPRTNPISRSWTWACRTSTA